VTWWKAATVMAAISAVLAAVNLALQIAVHFR
jgi:hypothetical protein